MGDFNHFMLAEFIKERKLELEALIFDVDGTLADTERDGHRVAFNEAFTSHGLDWHWSVEVYGKLLEVTGGKERIQYYINQYLENFTRDDIETFIATLHADKTRLYTELLATGKIPLRPGVKRLLEDARANNLRIAISTTTTPANVEALLVNTLGAEGMHWFEFIGAGDVVSHKKPAPDIYQLVMDKMGLQAGQCLAFEDSFNGIQSSSRAGLRTIVTVNGYTVEHDFSDALLVLDHFGEPDNSFTLLAGESTGGRYVDVDLLRHLHSAH
ncbi:Xylulose-1,5-bisphosphate phosphatase CbbY, converts this Rubisco inhibiting byproduct to xylulose-5P [hydrothermal vent metagenome]|uniref:Xylulose-1,5-bisphosphate phosphatase CbbY, converts this Rubisco inhibiting byproduct to xylulose-5P n=1 Tax=hydrothermal vent metagenome TaxID=652676 RepID=A0A3B0Y6Y6_9ZZZZ